MSKRISNFNQVSTSPGAKISPSVPADSNKEIPVGPALQHLDTLDTTQEAASTVPEPHFPVRPPSPNLKGVPFELVQHIATHLNYTDLRNVGTSLYGGDNQDELLRHLWVPLSSILKPFFPTERKDIRNILEKGLPESTLRQIPRSQRVEAVNFLGPFGLNLGLRRQLLRSSGVYLEGLFEKVIELQDLCVSIGDRIHNAERGLEVEGALTSIETALQIVVGSYGSGSDVLGEAITRLQVQLIQQGRTELARSQLPAVEIDDQRQVLRALRLNAGNARAVIRDAQARCCMETLTELRKTVFDLAAKGTRSVDRKTTERSQMNLELAVAIEETEDLVGSVEMSVFLPRFISEPNIAVLKSYLQNVLGLAMQVLEGTALGPATEDTVDTCEMLRLTAQNFSTLCWQFTAAVRDEYRRSRDIRLLFI